MLTIEMFTFFIIFLLSIIQSIFGIGLLILGTPILLLMNYSFIDVISITAPCSLTVSLAQTLMAQKKNYDKKFFNNNFFLLFFCILGIFLILIYENEINIKLTVGIIILFLILSKKYYNKIINYLIYNTKITFSFIGFIHGISNSGGSLLLLTLSIMNRGNKNKIRDQIGFSYFLLALTQFIILIFFKNNLFNELIIFNILIVLAGWTVGHNLIKYISHKNYNNYLDILIFIASTVLIIKNFK